MLFSVMVVFLFQVLALLKIGHDTTERWGRYNTACQKKAEVLRWRETVAGRAGSRAARADAVQGLEFYMMRAEFLRGRSAEEPHEAHTAVGGKRLPDDFDYAAYLGTSLGHMLAEVVEMTIPTWCVLALRCFLAPLARLTSHSYYPLVTHRGLMWVLAVAYTGAELALAGAVLPLALVWAAMGAADAVLCVLMVKKLSWIRKQMFAPSDAPELYHASTGAARPVGTSPPSSSSSAGTARRSTIGRSASSSSRCSTATRPSRPRTTSPRARHQPRRSGRPGRAHVTACGVRRRYQKILDGTVNYPADMNADAMDLVSKLLQKDISRRFGNMVNGTKDIKDHPFYSDINWDQPYGYRGSIKPSTFEPSKHEWLPAPDVVVESKPVKPADQAQFASF